MAFRPLCKLISQAAFVAWGHCSVSLPTSAQRRRFGIFHPTKSLLDGQKQPQDPTNQQQQQSTSSSSSSGAASSSSADPRQQLLALLFNTAKQKIDSNDAKDWDEAEQYLELCANLIGPSAAEYLHLLCYLRVRQNRLDDAVKARDELLERYPELLKNVNVLSNAAWLYVRQNKQDKALELLAKAEELSEQTKDLKYLRAYFLSTSGDLDKAEDLLRTCLMPNGTTLDNLAGPLEIKMALLLADILVQRQRPSEAEGLCAMIVTASKKAHGDAHPVTLQAIEARAGVLRALGKHKDAAFLLEPLVQEAMTNRTRIPSEHDLAVVGLMAKIYFDVFVLTSVQQRPLETLQQKLEKALQDWERVQRAILSANQSAGVQLADTEVRQHVKMYQALLPVLKDGSYVAKKG